MGQAKLFKRLRKKAGVQYVDYDKRRMLRNARTKNIMTDPASARAKYKQLKKAARPGLLEKARIIISKTHARKATKRIQENPIFQDVP